MSAARLVVAPIVQEPADGYGVVEVAGVQRRCYFDPTRLSGTWATGTRVLVSVQLGNCVALWRLP